MLVPMYAGVTVFIGFATLDFLYSPFVKECIVILYKVKKSLIG